MSTTLNLEEARAQLSRLVHRAACGEEFIIAEDGKPLARVVAVRRATERRALGGLAGPFRIPEDIKSGFVQEVESMFHPAK